MKEKIQPTFLLAATTWWPLSARLASALLQNGCSVDAICPPGHPLRHVKGIRRYHLYGRVNSLGALRKSLAASSPQLVIPCDDGAVWQLHQLYVERPELRQLIARSLGAAAHFDVVGSREQLQQVAMELNIRVPRARRLTNQNDLREWFEPGRTTVVLKQDGTWGGNGVRVVQSLDEAKSELARMLRPASWAVACKRMMVDRDPIALWSRRHSAAPAVTVQEFIPGRPANIMMACWKGQVLGAVMVEVLWSQGSTGAAMVVRLINHREMARAASQLARRLELSGFHGLDFVIEADSGAAYLIELNPRCTQLGHLPIAGQGSLAALLCRKLGARLANTAGQSKPAGLATGEIIAFFPKAFMEKRCLSDGFQDIPLEEPALLQELLKKEWPDRQWEARLYHWIRPRTEQPATSFDDSQILDDLQSVTHARDTTG